MTEEEEINDAQNNQDMFNLFFNDEYEKQEIHFPSGRSINFLGLITAMTDSDLTGQILWPGCTLLMHWLDKNIDIFNGKTAIEVGAGTAVCSAFVAKFGNPQKVVATDGSNPVVELMNKNIELHPDAKNIHCRLLPWDQESCKNLLKDEFPNGDKFDFVFGSEIAYNENCVEGLVDTVDILLKKDGKFIVGHIDRYAQTTRAFFKKLEKSGFKVVEKVPWDDLVSYKMEMIVGAVYVLQRI